jgi:hypothetical protein
MVKKNKKKKVNKNVEIPTEELKIVAFRWMSVCEPKKDSEN